MDYRIVLVLLFFYESADCISLQVSTQTTAASVKPPPVSENNSTVLSDDNSGELSMNQTSFLSADEGPLLDGNETEDNFGNCTTNQTSNLSADESAPLGSDETSSVPEDFEYGDDLSRTSEDSEEPNSQEQTAKNTSHHVHQESTTQKSTTEKLKSTENPNLSEKLTSGNCRTSVSNRFIATSFTFILVFWFQS